MKTFYSTTLALILSVGLLFAGALPHAAQAQQMSLGSEIPNVGNLEAPDGQTSSLADLRGANGTVVIFWSNQCTWTDRYEDRLISLHDEFGDQDLDFVLVNANDSGAFPQESLENIREKGYDMPYLRDNQGELVDALGAERTPHVYVFGSNDTLVYVGSIDDSPGDPNNIENHYLRDALEAVLAGEDVAVAETKPFGCSLKQ